MRASLLRGRLYGSQRIGGLSLLQAFSVSSVQQIPLATRPSASGALGLPLRARPFLPQQRLLATAAKSQETAGFIPIIDFSRFLRARNDQERVEVSKEITEAFKSAGFVYLKGHGIEQSQLDKTFDMSLRFFQLPLDVKSRLAWKDPRANRGYVAEGRERVTQATSAEEIASLREQAPDYKESMEIGREVDDTWKNEWPGEETLPGYRDTMLAFRTAAHQLHLEVMKSIALGLNLPGDYFDEKCNEEWHTLRLLHYPSVEAKKLEGGGSRAGEHSDYGTVTLLFQDNVGGLEVRNPNTGTYQAAPPVEGCVVVNVGDLLARWSNDTLRSTLHRVVSPPSQSRTGLTPARQSVVLFANPNEHERIEVLPTCVGSGRKYEPVTASDYLAQRLSETYS